MQVYRIYWIFILCFSAFSLMGQEAIPIQNPSFEDYPRAGTVNSRAPLGWYDCGKSGETAPDIQPGQFEVTMKAFSDTTYLGLVVRDNETWEAVGQRLRQPLEKGKCYTFGMQLARSPKYVSISRTTNVETNYNNPVKIRIWGGNGYCSKNELLDESSLVDHPNWRPYQFRFEPSRNHTFILLEAFWQTPVLIPTNGNVLVDDASDIFIIPCDKDTPSLTLEPPVVDILNPQQSGLKSEDNTFTVRAKIENVTHKRDIEFKVNATSPNFSFDSNKGLFRSTVPLLEGNNRIEITATNSGGTGKDNAIVVYFPKVVNNPTPKPPAPEENYIHNPELADKVEEGKVMKIDKLYFEADSSRIRNSAFPILDEVVIFLTANPGISIEIGGHTNNRCATSFCNRLSESRAKAVVSYLASRGIERNRLSFKGYGKTKPIATNETLKGRRKNQRVEIKVVKLSG